MLKIEATETHPELFWEVRYSKGGYNNFTGKMEARGFSLHIHRSETIFKAFTPINKPKGATRFFLHEVGRYSQKQEDIAYDKAEVKLKEIIAAFEGEWEYAASQS